MAYLIDSSSFQLSALALEVSEKKRALTLSLMKGILEQMPGLQATALIIRLCEDIRRFADIKDDDPVVLYGVDEFGTCQWTQVPSVRLNKNDEPCVNIGSHFVSLDKLLDEEVDILAEVISVQSDNEVLRRPVVSYVFDEPQTPSAGGMKRPPVVIQLPLAVRGETPEEIHENWEYISQIWSSHPDDYFSAEVTRLIKRESLPFIGHKNLVPGRYKITGAPTTKEISYVNDGTEKTIKKTVLTCEGFTLEFPANSKVVPVATATILANSSKDGYWLTISDRQVKVDKNGTEKVYLSGNVSLKPTAAAMERLPLIESKHLEKMSSDTREAMNRKLGSDGDITTITVVPH